MPSPAQVDTEKSGILISALAPGQTVPLFASENGEIFAARGGDTGFENRKVFSTTRKLICAMVRNAAVINHESFAFDCNA